MADDDDDIQGLHSDTPSAPSPSSEGPTDEDAEASRPLAQRRVRVVDQVRGASVLLMILVHTMWIYSSLETQENTWLGSTLHVLAQGTCAFLVAMGFSFMMSSRSSLRGGLQRGLLILAVAWGMNLLKFIIPLALGVIPDGFIAAYGWERPLEARHWVQLMLNADILQMAGLSFLIMGVLIHVTRNKWVYAVLALAGGAVGHVIQGANVGVRPIDYLLDLFWAWEIIKPDPDAYWFVYFPVFPWITPIFAGMAFGAWYTEMIDGLKYEDEVEAKQSRMYWVMLVVGLLGVGVGAPLVLKYPETHFRQFFHTGWGGIVYLTGLNFLILVGARILERYLRHILWWLRATLDYFSARVTSMYLVSWILICWGMGIFGFWEQDVEGTLLAIPFTLGGTLLVQWGWDTYQRRRRQRTALVEPAVAE
ncbi:MAG: heparan-alpha-glucosaminide N-acetyltransferase domain-containing protein [Myxococcota bacterium]